MALARLGDGKSSWCLYCIVYFKYSCTIDRCMAGTKISRDVAVVKSGENWLSRLERVWSRNGMATPFMYRAQMTIQQLHCFNATASRGVEGQLQHDLLPSLNVLINGLKSYGTSLLLVHLLCCIDHCMCLWHIFQPLSIALKDKNSLERDLHDFADLLRWPGHLIPKPME